MSKGFLRTWPRRAWAALRRGVRSGAAAGAAGNSANEGPASMHVSSISAVAIMGEIRAMADRERDGLSDDERGKPDW